MSAKTVLLNRKLENLRTQYQNNIKSMDEMRSEYEKSLTDRLAAMQNEMQNKLSEHDEVLRTEYEKYLEEYSAALNKELNKKIDDISAGYAKLKEENDLMYARMKEIELSFMCFRKFTSQRVMYSFLHSSGQFSR